MCIKQATKMPLIYNYITIKYVLHNGIIWEPALHTWKCSVSDLQFSEPQA